MSTLFLSLKSLPLSRASLSFSGCRRGLCKAVLGLFILIFAGAVLPAACITDASNPGCAHLALRTSSSFDVYTNHPGTYGPWLNEHLWRMQTSTPYFNRKLSWFRNAWAYIDSYAIYRGSALLTQHPEWVLRDSEGNALFIPWGCSNGTCPQYAADISSQDYRNWWIQQAKGLMATGYKGLWIDDVNLIMQVGNGYGHRVAPIDRATGRPMTTNAWEKYFADFMTQVRQALPKAEILHNSLWFAGSGARGSDPYVQQEIKAADWINRESGISDTGITGDDGPWSVQEFFRFVDIVHSLGAQIDIQEFDMNGEYGIAGYFLVSNGTDAFGAGISPDKWPAVLDVDLGNPQGPRYGWKGLIRRDFENGMVLLNPPGKPTARVDVNGSYVDSNGRVVSEVALAGKQGIVLLGKPAEEHQVVAVPVRMNVCGTAAGVFGSDQYFDGGHCDTFTSAVDLSRAVAAAPESVYQSKRTTNPNSPGFSYIVTNLVAGHSYLVRMHFADDQSRNAGNRVFNVVINGKLVLKNFDIYAATGGRLRAIVKEVYGIKPDS
ncbi:MAG TPA: malectin domain-containing carbohydrate-binding protein, partial [Bryobacteraceae bacterium]|nr:malectin domain-containing carbohydrate-binding protein [Bryobacteraceae bacterium]